MNISDYHADGSGETGQELLDLLRQVGFSLPAGHAQQTSKNAAPEWAQEVSVEDEFEESLLKSIVKAGKPSREKVQTEKRKPEAGTCEKRPIFRGWKEITNVRGYEGSKQWMGKERGERFPENKRIGGWVNQLQTLNKQLEGKKENLQKASWGRDGEDWRKCHRSLF